jgi:hypothetical protein
MIRENLTMRSLRGALRLRDMIIVIERLLKVLDVAFSRSIS